MENGIAKFENMKVWEESFKLSVQVYNLIKNSMDYGLKDQIVRSSLSIPSNIAEGFDRNNDKEFIRFLNFAKASCGELRTQIYFCNEIGIIDNEISKELIDKTLKISAMIYNLIKAIKKRLT